MKYKPILNGITNGSNCIIVIILKCPSCQNNYISCINPAGTNKSTFSAQHTLSYVMPYLIIFTPFYENMKFSEAESGKIAGCACCGTTTTLNTQPETWFPLINIFCYPPVVGFIVDLTSFWYDKTEFFHFFHWSRRKSITSETAARECEIVSGIFIGPIHVPA